MRYCNSVIFGKKAHQSDFATLVSTEKILREIIQHPQLIDFLKKKIIEP